MKIRIDTNGKKNEVDLPVSWDEVTFQQFLDLSSSGNDYANVISILTKIDLQTLKQAKISNLDSVISLIGFLKTAADPVIPKTILGYPVPKDLGLETIAQFEDMKTEMASVESNTIQAHLMKYPTYCAIYACNPYDWQKAEEMSKEFFNAPCREVIGIGNFTLAKLVALTTSTGQDFQKPSILKKKSGQVLIFWLRHLGFMLHSYISKRKP